MGSSALLLSGKTHFGLQFPQLFLHVVLPGGITYLEHGFLHSIKAESSMWHQHLVRDIYIYIFIYIYIYLSLSLAIYIYIYTSLYRQGVGMCACICLFLLYASCLYVHMCTYVCTYVNIVLADKRITEIMVQALIS